MSPRWRGVTRLSSAALSRNVAASSMNAAPAPAVVISAVATAGPITSDALSGAWVRPAADWISSSGTVCGSSSPLKAGAKNASAQPNAVSIAIRATGASDR